jgi:hypothetical protein
MSWRLYRKGKVGQQPYTFQEVADHYYGRDPFGVKWLTVAEDDNRSVIIAKNQIRVKRKDSGKIIPRYDSPKFFDFYKGLWEAENPVPPKKARKSAARKG